MTRHLSYKDGVVNMVGCNVQRTYDCINYDPNETYFTESVTYVSDLNDYALKTELPTIPDDLINEEALTTKLNDYAKAQDLQSYALKTDIPQYLNANSEWTTNAIKLNKPTTMNGLLTVNGTADKNGKGVLHCTVNDTTNGFVHSITSIAPNLQNGGSLLNYYGKELTNDKAAYFGYKEPGCGTLGLWSAPNVIVYNKSSISLNQPTTITGNLNVTGVITNASLNSKLIDYALKTENEELKAKITALEARLSVIEKSLDPDSEWKEFYAEYSVKHDFDRTTDDNSYYWRSGSHDLSIYPAEDIGEGEWLFVFVDNDGKKHFYEWNTVTTKVRFDHFYETAEWMYEEELCVNELNVPTDKHRPVNEIYLGLYAI